jgi:hypothetical protein
MVSVWKCRWCDQDLRNDVRGKCNEEICIAIPERCSGKQSDVYCLLAAGMLQHQQVVTVGG